MSERPLEDQYEEAERYFRSGHFRKASSCFFNVATQIFDPPYFTRPRNNLTERFTLRAVDRLVELVPIHGKRELVDRLLTAKRNVLRANGRFHKADFALVEQIAFALESDQLQVAKRHLSELLQERGEVLPAEFTPTELEKFEKRFSWSDMRNQPQDRSDADTDIFFIALYLVVGKLKAEADGHYEYAVAAFERGLQHYRSHGQFVIDVEKFVMLSLALVQIHLECGHIQQARRALKDIKRKSRWFIVNKFRLPFQQFLSYVGSKHKPWKIKKTLLSPLQIILMLQQHEVEGKLALLEGDLGRAESYFRKARKICAYFRLRSTIRTIRKHLTSLYLLLNMFTLLSKDERWKRRVSQLNRSFVVLSNTDTLAPGHNQQQVGEMKAAPAGENKEPEQSEGSDQPASFFHFENQRDAFYQLVSDQNWAPTTERYAAIEKRYATIEKHFEKNQSCLLQAQLLEMKSVLALLNNKFEDGKLAQAIDSLEQARGILQSLGSTFNLQRVLTRLGRCYRLDAAKKEKEDAERDLSQANTLLMKAEQALSQADTYLMKMADSLDAAKRTMFLLSRWQTYDELLTVKVRQLKELKGADAFPAIFQLLREIDRKKNTIFADASSRRPFWSRLRHESSFRDLAISSDRVRVCFVVLEEHTLIVRFGGGLSAWHQVLDIRREDLRKEVKDSIENLTKKENPFQKLSQTLKLCEIFKEVPSGRKLTFVLDDCLHLVSTGALFGRPGQYLIRDHPINVDFDYIPRSAPITPVPQPQKALVVAGSDGKLESNETKDVTKFWKEQHATILQPDHYPKTEKKREQYKPQILLSLLEANYIHFAGHGEFSSTNPFGESGFLLTKDPETGNTKEKLRFRDLLALNFNHVDLLTFSACALADNVVFPGHWRLHIPEAAWRLGAKRIVGGLWPFPERMAHEFMNAFYNNLGEKMPCDEALQQAQISCIKRKFEYCKEDDSCVPYLWAPFTLYGDPGPIFLPST